MLPPYMLPSRCVTIDEVPLTPNAKVDYQRLADLDDARPKTRMTREEMYEVMLGIWSTVLKEEVGDLDLSFFTLGGDSILAVQMVAHARERSVPISLRQVFVQPTIRKLVDAVVGAAADPESDPELEDIVRAATHEAGSALRPRKRAPPKGGSCPARK